ncbi:MULTISPECIES: hypothetical protein [unclassified Leucobacter]|uniref:hypothetical protein n=1 Tax=unclassified Leucobacter TaxID=2621730 RepID=UPI000ACE938D|nr:hypothetical protein [Leucobacter sp. L43]
MTGSQQDHRVRHLIALALGLLCILYLFVQAGDVTTYVILLGLSCGGVAVGHQAILRSGPLVWTAIIGLVLSYLGLLMAIGLLVVRLTRTFGS